MNIFLDGYYNYGNYGDDMLMNISINFLKKMNKPFFLKKNSINFYPSYLNFKCIEDDINLYTLKGGGGLYFDFNENGSFIDLCLNRLVKFTFFRKLIFYFSRRNENKNNIFLGVGIGPYSKKSERLWKHLIYFESVKLFVVRDINSKIFLEKNKFKNIIVTSDLVFFKQFWNIEIKSLNKNNKIGIILRYWKYKEINYSKIINNITEQYGIDNCTLILLDKNDDLLINQNNGIKKVIYKGQSVENLIEFTNILNGYSLFFTMRAHGALIPSILGIPSVLIPIEEKLMNVNKMIPEYTFLNESIEKYDFKLIDDWFNNLDYEKAINEINKNQEQWEKNLKKILEFL